LKDDDSELGLTSVFRLYLYQSIHSPIFKTDPPRESPDLSRIRWASSLDGLSQALLQIRPMDAKRTHEAEQ
jgi:hypothetical protein